MNDRYTLFYQDVKNAQKRLDKAIKQFNLLVQWDITKFLTNQLFVPIPISKCTSKSSTKSSSKYQMYHPVTGMVFDFSAISTDCVLFRVKHETWLGSKNLYWYYRRRTFEDFYTIVLSKEIRLAHKYK